MKQHIEDFESIIQEREAKLRKDLKISTAVRIDFFPNTMVNIFIEYDEKSKTFVINLLAMGGIKNVNSLHTLAIQNVKVLKYFSIISV